MKRAAAGRLIVLEGGEGAGKSTQAAFVEAWLRQRGRAVLRTREPGGSPLAEEIRGLVLKRWEEGIDGNTELLLMFAARAAHLHAKIRPALGAGMDVVCDRFVDATYAYQGAGRKLGTRVIDALASIVLGTLKPDLVILLDIDPVTGLSRVRERGAADRFEGEALAFQQRVRRAYRARARKQPRRYAVIDAAAGPADVSAAIARALERLR
jgi:dTMP kinase